MHRKPSVWHTVGTLSVGDTSLSPAHSRTSVKTVLSDHRTSKLEGASASLRASSLYPGQDLLENIATSGPPASFGWVIPLVHSHS